MTREAYRNGTAELLSLRDAEAQLIQARLSLASEKYNYLSNLLDLEYAEDSEAETDMNIVMNDGGAFIEIQGTAEGHAFRHEEMQAMLALADKGIREIMQVQKQALGL